MLRPYQLQVCKSTYANAAVFLNQCNIFTKRHIVKSMKLSPFASMFMLDEIILMLVGYYVVFWNGSKKKRLCCRCQILEIQLDFWAYGWFLSRYIYTFAYVVSVFIYDTCMYLCMFDVTNSRWFSIFYEWKQQQ